MSITCKMCNYEASGNQELGKHYRKNPDHRPSFKIRKKTQNGSFFNRLASMFDEVEGEISVGHQKINEARLLIQQQIDYIKRLEEIRNAIESKKPIGDTPLVRGEA